MIKEDLQENICTGTWELRFGVCNGHSLSIEHYIYTVLFLLNYGLYQ